MRSLVRPVLLTLVVFGAVVLGAFVLQRIDGGTGWTDSLSAIATVGATGAALYIATRDRSERVAEQIEGDRAQARLVLLELRVNPVAYDDTPRPTFNIEVRNHGSLPILDVNFETGCYIDGPHQVALEPERPTVSRIDILRPDSPPGTLSVTHAHGDPTAPTIFEPEGGVAGTWHFRGLKGSNVQATVVFTDANGNTWRRSTTGTIELVRQG